MKQNKIIGVITKVDFIQWIILLGVKPYLWYARQGLLYTFLLCLLIPMSAKSQSTKVLVRNAPDSLSFGRTAIHVKWFDLPNIFTEKALDVYRQESGGVWQKVNDKPIIKQDSITDMLALQKQPYVYALAETVNNATKEEMKGLMLVQLLFASFKNYLFADFLGIQYLDKSVEAGKSYRYQLRVTATGQIKGESEWLLAGSYRAQSAFSQVEFKAKRKRIYIEWENNNEHCWGIDIYRTSPDKEELKLTKSPIVAAAINGAEKSNPYFVDDSLAEETNYIYRIVGTDYFGSPTEPYVQEVFLPDMTPPMKPLIRNHGIFGYDWRCSWEVESQEDLKGYYVYRGRNLNDSSSFHRVSELIVPSDTNAFSQNLEAIGPSYYYIASIDNAGNEMISRKLYADVRDITPPQPPTGLETLADSGMILLQWEPSPSADVLGYVVIRSADFDDKGYEVDLNEPMAILSYVDSLPYTAKNKFAYKVVAIDSSFNRSKPSEVAINQMPDVLAPERPVIINSYQKEGHLVIEWLPNEDLDLKGYNLYRAFGSEKSDFEQVNLKEIPIFSHHYTDLQAIYGQDYFYYLTAHDSAGNHSLQSEVYATRNAVPPPTTVQSEVEQITITYDKKKDWVYCKWKIIHPEKVRGAVVYRFDNQLNQLAPLTGLITETEYKDMDVKPDNQYSYQIRFYLQNGIILKSEEEKVIIKK